jgi:ketosteroid isomerase-like protein
LTSLPAPDTQRATSRAEVEVVRRIVDSLSAGKIDEALRGVADDFEVDLSNSIGPLKGVYRGRQAAYELWASLLNAWTTVHFDLIEAIDVGDSRVILISRVQMRRPGAYEDDIYPQLWTLSGDKAERVKFYRSKPEALEAAGLRE